MDAFAFPSVHPAPPGREFGLPPGVRRAYVVAGAKRCGSSHLCAMLNNTGLLGRPEEYFHPDRLPSAAIRSQALARAEWDRIADAASTPNGVLGLKLFYGHLDRCRDRRFDAVLADMDFILLERTDRLAQAISLARAMQTESWSSHQPEQRDPTYRRRLIADCLETIDREMAGWEAFFQVHGIRPLRISYEGFAADPETTVAGIARHLGVEPAGLPPLRSLKRIQRDALNRQWRERFLAEAGR